MILAAVPSVSASACLVFLVVIVPGCPKLTARPRGHDKLATATLIPVDGGKVHWSHGRWYH